MFIIDNYLKTNKLIIIIRYIKFNFLVDKLFSIEMILMVLSMVILLKNC